MSIARTLTKNSHHILTGMGIAGFVSAIIFAAKAAPKAEEALRMPAPPPTTIEKIKIVLPYYVPTIVMGVASTACIIAGHNIANKRTAAVASLYTLAQATMERYQEKVIEKIGESKNDLIRGEMAQERLNATESRNKVTVVTGNGNTLCFDSFSGRAFKSDIESIRKAINEFNRMLLIRDWLSINDFYEMIGLDSIDMGNEMGWVVDRGMLDVKFYPKMDKNDQVYLVLEYKVQPIHIQARENYKPYNETNPTIQKEISHVRKD